MATEASASNRLVGELNAILNYAEIMLKHGPGTPKKRQDAGETLRECDRIPALSCHLQSARDAYRCAEEECNGYSKMLNELVWLVSTNMPGLASKLPALTPRKRWAELTDEEQESLWRALGTVQDEARRLFRQSVSPPADQEESPNAHSPDFRSVRWNDVPFSFTSNQAAVVECLWMAWKNGTPDVGDETLLTRADVSGRIVHLFREHPAWGSMIIAGGTKGTRRLAADDQ